MISAATWSQHLRAALVIFVEAVGVPDVAAASHSHAHGDASDSHQPSSSSAEISAVTPALPPPPSVALPPAPHLSFMLRDRLDAVRQMIETQLGSQASMIHVGTITGEQGGGGGGDWCAFVIRTVGAAVSHGHKVELLLACYGL